VSYLCYRFLTTSLGEKTFVVRLIEAFVPIGLGGVTFLVVAKLLRITEIDKVYDMLARKLGVRK
jgi:hypothetical protein